MPAQDPRAEGAEEAEQLQPKEKVAQEADEAQEAEEAEEKQPIKNEFKKKTAGHGMASIYMMPI